MTALKSLSPSRSLWVLLIWSCLAVAFVNIVVSCPVLGCRRHSHSLLSISRSLGLRHWRSLSFFKFPAPHQHSQVLYVSRLVFLFRQSRIWVLASSKSEFDLFFFFLACLVRLEGMNCFIF